MCELNLTNLVASFCDADVELVDHAIDVEIGHARQHPPDSIRPKPQPAEQVGGEWYRGNLGGPYEVDLPRGRVGVGIDALGKDTCHGDDLPVMQNEIADAKSGGIHSHSKNELNGQKV